MSHPLDEPSTSSRWLAQPGPINLRHSEHKWIGPHEAQGIITAIVISGAVFIWAFVLVRLLLMVFV